MLWVDERAEPDAGHHARLAGGNGAIELGDHALRPAMCLDLLLARQLPQARRATPAAGDHPPDQSLEAEMPHAARLAVAGAGSEQQRQVARPPFREEALLDRGRHRLGMATPAEAGGGDRHPVTE